MLYKLICFVGVLQLAIGTSMAGADREASIHIVDYGIYSPDRNNPEVRIQTERVPATVGTVFGIRVSKKGALPEVLEYKWTFPRMQNPSDGRVWTEMAGTKEVTDQGPHALLVSINNEWEAKPGEWTIQLIQVGRVVLEKTFHVYALTDPS
jgi:hypothetical protein